MTRLLLLGLLATACASDLLEDERVLGEQVPAVRIEGAQGDQLGAGVAVGRFGGEVRVAVGLPGSGLVRLYTAEGQLVLERAGPVGVGQALLLADDALWLVEPDVGVVRVDADGAESLVLEDPTVARFARCPDGRLETTADPGDAVACGDQGRVLRLSCEGDACRVTLDDQPLDDVGPGGAVGFHGDLACWGDPALAQPDGGGVVRCDDGRSVQGLVGEHLGRSLAGGRAAGVVDKWIVPARGRIHPLDGGQVWAVADTVENARLVLAQDQGLLVVGVPEHAVRTADHGAVYIVDLDEAAAAGRRGAP